MRAMVIPGLSRLPENRAPLTLLELPPPQPLDDEILVRVSACGVCHTELDEIEGRTPPPRFPIIPGHQVVGRVAQVGEFVHQFKAGDRVGIAWIYTACGNCRFCLAGEENLCDRFQATGRDAHGGYTEYMTVKADFAHPIPESIPDAEAAPLLCAGAIGYRSLRLTGLSDGESLGLTGFGASAHLVLKLVQHQYPGSKIYIFSRSPAERAFALELGATWSGDIGEDAPQGLDCIIDTTPAWKPVLEALRNLKSGGRLVINAIRKEATDRDYLLELDYPSHLWMEKEIKSVANVTRRDVRELLALAAQIPLRPEYQAYPLEEANLALLELKERKIRGAKVLVID